MSRGKHFLREELEYIKVHSLDMSISEIAKALGRNYWAIQRVMRERVGVEKHNHMFTANDDYVIRQMYGKYSIKLIATKIGVSVQQIQNRVKKLDIRTNHVYTAEEDFLIRQMYGKATIEEIMQSTGLNKQQIEYRAKKLGIRK